MQERVRAAGTAVGADLSGGLDSSSAAILAAEVGDVHAVTYADRYTSTEDETLAARLAEHAGLLHTVTFGGDGELPFSFPPGQPTGDEPTLDAAVYAMDRAYLKPVAGLPLHLTGHGGDVVLDAIHLGQPHHLGDAAIHQAAEAAGADSVIAALPGGLDTSLARSWWGGHDLSGGQWQRLAIARAFHRDAPVLVLDEPTAALDARAEHRVFTRLKALSRGRATIFITHRLANARIADRIIVLDGGRVAETGTYTELMARGNASLFHQMLRLQEDA
ncbi:asparagine synthase-related protein [Streptomyces sp. NPDC048718]|uniref:asparagine synthase-related protein n=1 Tax=Streptomyces sp. NPDC048718 TaxID=3365587 RepID=UPI00371C391A